METLRPFSVVLPIMSSNVRREDGGGRGWNLDWYGSSQIHFKIGVYRSFFVLRELKAIYPLNGMIDESLLQCVRARANCYHLSYLMTGSRYQFVGKAAHLNQIYPSFQQNNFIHPVTKLKCYF